MRRAVEQRTYRVVPYDFFRRTSPRQHSTGNKKSNRLIEWQRHQKYFLNRFPGGNRPFHRKHLLDPKCPRVPTVRDHFDLKPQHKDNQSQSHNLKMTEKMEVI